ncbi:PQQ-dependent sugar dehydrogenase [Algoriphagus sp.]|jgi:glucose/arabinose dehydrogenase|uniref:PQQ-dependent sugar dehydrogenase n=1 Tax=Algoriphagus sp. TaxID=1872435 RepID=UPI002716F563|nr:PQQ-dependent sugar dehydrogenase [Algoriphagus sp.]MDO8966943.1 PQQ-dependent sugar dehydrogenase [Algoriphagus sp.]MDP3199733.1 PQQ-dependent sugar dehydrogenase [Algoriphagus sp.]
MTRTLLALLFCLAFLSSCTKEQPKLSLQQLDIVRLQQSWLKVEVLSDSMIVPWDLETDSQGFLWVAEQEGKVSRINLSTAEKKVMLVISDVWQQRTSGLLGMAVHPDFANNPFVYLNYTVKKDSLISSRLFRYKLDKDSLTDPILLLEIEGGTSHNGSRLAFGPDGKLYWATGDTHDFTYAQNSEKLNGKILRMNPDGSIPSDNPDPGSLVWAKGFRNMQGLTFSDSGLLYTSEHGDAIEDEVNLIIAGGNYGWPIIEGMHDLDPEKVFAGENQTIEPIRSWTPVIAPAGIAFYGEKTIPEWTNTLLLTTLKGKSLRILQLSQDGKTILDEEILFENHYGRLRDVTVGPKGEIYLSTSNKDWNPQPGFPLPGDDKILKISLTDQVVPSPLEASKPAEPLILNGEQLYLNYCASCHKANGTGLSEVFPTLAGSTLVKGNVKPLIQLVLKGKNQMPAFGFLSNREAAEILTYIRQNWGNKASEITSPQVEENR